jgi:hypothetical protein
VAGTVGHKLMSGKPTKINLDKDTQIDVRCQVHIDLPPLVYHHFHLLSHFIILLIKRVGF